MNEVVVVGVFTVAAVVCPWLAVLTMRDLGSNHE